MAQFVVTGITLAGRGSIHLHVQCFQSVGWRRLRAIAALQSSAFAAYRACRGSADATARSVSSGLTIISSPASRTATNAPSRAT